MSIGALEVRLLADVAQLRSDMNAAAGIVTGTADKMSAGFGAVKTALGAIGVSLSAAAFANWIKGAIDAGDQMKAFSQKTGVAVKDVAGLQLAFKQGGVESETLQKALKAMNASMATGSDAFATLGVKTRDASGAMRPMKDVLYETFDALKDVKGENERLALATEIFKKAGMDLMPVIEGGSEELEKMAEMADKLGLSMSGEAADAADSFNDTLELLGTATQGVGRQVAQHLLPALNGIVGSFLEFITEGDRVNKMSDIIVTGLKSLYAAGRVIVEVFNTVGKTVGASMAAIVKVMQGDFKGAIAVGKEWATDMKTDWTGAIKNVGDAWDGTSSTTVQSLAKMQRPMRDVKVATDDQKKAAAELAQQEKARAKEREKEIEKHAELVKKASEAISKDWVATIDAQIEAERKQALALAATMKAVDDIVDAIDRQTEELGMSNQEREISNTLLALEKAGLVKGTEAYYEYAKKVRDAVVNRDTVAKSIEASKSITDNWNELTKEIGQGLTDSLFRAFESGGSFFKTLWDGIVNTFKTTTLRLIINTVMRPVNGAVGSLLGAGSANAGGIGIGDILGSMNSGGLFGGTDIVGGLGALGGLGASLGTFGTAAGYGATALFGGTGLTALSGAGSMLAAGSTAAGLGMAAGVLGPIALAGAGLYALYKNLKHTKTPHTGGYAIADASGTRYATGVSTTQTDSGVQTSLESTFGGIQRLLTNVGQRFNRPYSFTVGGGYEDDSSSDPALGAFGIKTSRAGHSWESGLGKSGGMFGRINFADGEAGLQAYMKSVGVLTKDALLEIGLPEWAKKIVRELGDSPALEQLEGVARLIINTADAIDGMRKALEPLGAVGGIFTRVAQLSDDAALELADFAGGMEALLSKTRGYVSSFYTEQEQSAISANSIVDALKAVGITKDLGSKDDFRALVESRDITTTEGRQQLAALLNLAPDFAALATYMQSSGLTLQGIASMDMPIVKIMKELNSAGGVSGPTSPAPAGGPTGNAAGAGPTENANGAGPTSPATLTDSGPAKVRIDDSFTESIVDRIGLLEASMNKILTTIAASTAATARQLSAWDDGDAVATRAAT